MKTVTRKRYYGLLTLLCVVLLAHSASAETDISGQANILADKLTSIKKGEVLDGSDIDVYINIGEKQGIVPGARFEIFRRGDPLKVNNNIVGYKESKVALVKVDRIRENVSNCSVLVKKETPKSGDKAYEHRAPIKRLVVAQFSYNQSYNQFTKNLQEKLFASFINKGMQVVERDQLEKVLAEQQLGYSGLVNIESAKKIGELLGAEAMLLGSVSDLSDSISLNARLVDLGTGDSLTAAETSMPKTPQIVDLLSNPVEEKPYVMRWNGSKPTKLVVSNRRKIQQHDSFFENGFLNISPKSISLSKDKKSLSLALLFTNRTAETLYLGIESRGGSMRGGQVAATIMSDKGAIIGPSGWNQSDGTRVMGLNIIGDDTKKYRYSSLDKNSQSTLIFTFISKKKIAGDVFSFSAELLRLIKEKITDEDNEDEVIVKITHFTIGIPVIVMQQ